MLEVPSMRIVSRAEWGARKPTRSHRISLPTRDLFIHHTDSTGHTAAAVRAIQAFHMDRRNWSDIAYSFLVNRDGVVFEGRGAGVAGGHTAGHNTTSHAICLIGRFEQHHPTDAQLAATAELVRHGQANGWWGDITGGHRDARGASTLCPGRHLQARLPDLRRMVAAPPEEDDMTDEDRTLLRQAMMHAKAAHETTARVEELVARIFDRQIPEDTMRNHIRLLREVAEIIGADKDT
jgi:hypothetical protein